MLAFLIFFQWIISSGMNGFKTELVPMVGDYNGFSGLIGVVMLNFAFVITVPSWINIKVILIYFKILI